MKRSQNEVSRGDSGAASEHDSSCSTAVSSSCTSAYKQIKALARVRSMPPTIAQCFAGMQALSDCTCVRKESSRKVKGGGSAASPRRGIP